MANVSKYTFDEIESRLDKITEILNRLVGIEESIKNLAGTGEKVLPEYRDILIIPDKYNTGVDESVIFEVVTAAATLANGVKFSNHTSGSSLKCDFRYSNRSFTSASEVVFENYDFQVGITMQGEELADGDTPKTLIFNNCKFTNYNTSKTGVGLVSYEFNDCTFVGGFRGSNAVLKNCRLGGTVDDAIVAYQNVTVDSCYIADMAHYSTGASHTDGLQIYGEEGYGANNILVKNSRFEIPPYPITGNASYVNACIFIGLEKGNGADITVENCIMNGGGKMIYCSTSGNYTLTNVTINNIYAGYSHRYGLGVSTSTNMATVTNVEHYNSLYCSSVWKETSGDVKVIVSNDTRDERTLRIYSSSDGYVDFVIPGVPAYDDIVADSISFVDFPFDLEYTITGNPDFVVVYDVTDKANIKQIRFVNFTDEDVYIGAPVDMYQKLQELESRVAALEV